MAAWQQPAMSNLDSLFEDKKIIEASKGKIIVYEGHNVNKIYRVVQGYVKVYTIARSNVQRMIFIYQPGDIFPLTTFLSSHRVARFFYEALSPATLQYITPKQLENKLMNNLELGEEIIGYTSYLDSQFLERVNSMVSGKSPQSKVKDLLLFICDRNYPKKNIVDIDILLDSNLVASMCGISSREAELQINILKTADIISNSGGIKINPQKLKKFKAV
jgi:CRP-like cAMP-binding protein